MLFNSLGYGLFLCTVFALYWTIGRDRVRAQNVLLLLCSYLFYGLWDWRYLFLIIGITALGFVCSLMIDGAKSAARRRLWLTVAVAGCLATLGVFKYYNFFVSQLAALVGADSHSLLLNVLLPVGISFYTFQSIGYCCDVYMRRTQATRDALSYFTFVAFFPQLVAGPIERFTNLFPQICSRRSFDEREAYLGLRLILWGLFKKIVIADHAAMIVDLAFADVDGFNSTSLWISACLFSLQIYCDFSGYSDIAIGSARLFGIRLMQNFRSPYLAVGIQDFWKRWHISLTTWFRDYVYIPLGGNRTGHRRRNTWAVFLLSGMWHGANWTFVLWGAYHALLNDVERALSRPFTVLPTFLLATVGWVIFRAVDVTQAVHYIACMFTPSRFGGFEFSSLAVAELLLAVGVMFAFELTGRDKECPFAFAGRWRMLRYPVYLALSVWTIVSFTATHSFIYFQF